MRVLVCCIPQLGHFNPVAPLIRALVSAGDEVLVAGGAELQGPAEALGASYQLAGGSLGDWFGRLQQRTRGVPGDGLPPARIQHYFLPRLFAEIAADDMVGDVLAAGEAFRPDWVLHDAATFAGPLVADLLGARSANHAYGPLIEPAVLELAADALSPLWRSYGRDVPPCGGAFRDVTIAICPPSMDRESGAIADVLYLQPAPPPAHAPQPQSPPLVYVTFGTVWANPSLLRQCLEALADEPVQVVMTTGQVAVEEVKGVAGNAHIERFVPQAELLPRCSAVVHHAGAGTMFGALAHGLAQVALPQAADNFTNAAILTASGAGLTLLPSEVAPDRIRAAVRAALNDSSHRSAAQALAGEMAAMPSAPDVAERLRAAVQGSRRTT